MQIYKLDHYTIIVSCLDATSKFYSDVLSMVLLPRPDFDFQGLWFGAGELQIHAILENELTGPAGLERSEKGRPSRHTHFALKVADFDSVVEEISKTDTTVLDGPKQRPDGVRQLFIADPDGYIIELCE